MRPCQRETGTVGLPIALSKFINGSVNGERQRKKKKELKPKN
jgi:hypothetical protein